jgi:hypothetical protein
VTGRVVKDGIPVEAGVTVKLEDPNYTVVGTANTDAQGVYTFDGLTVSSAEFNVLFSKEFNERYDDAEVVSWTWLGPVTVSETTTELPDFEVGLLSFEQIHPPPEESLSVDEISAQNLLTFEWTPYPGASVYWVDLMQGDDLNLVWQSPFVDTTAVGFNGTLDDDSHITPGTYWWGVGASKEVGEYELTAYGYLTAFDITP